MFSPKKPCPKIKELKRKDLHENRTLKNDLQRASDKQRAHLLKKYVGKTIESDRKKYFDYYKLYFDHYVGTRAERTEWNKYFLTLLFIQTLVAILTALLGANGVLGVLPSNTTVGANGAIQLGSFTLLLIIIIVVVAAAISITWFARLRYMKNLIAAEETVLKDMEQALLLPFAGIYREDCAFYEEDGMIGVPFLRHNYIEQQTWVKMNYWFLPLLLFITFIVIGVYLILFPLLHIF